MKTYFVYIMTNLTHSVLYIGITNDLDRRVMEHKKHLIPGFTDRYNCEHLVYFEDTNSIHEAIAREKQLKKWSRAKKNHLIQSFNPGLKDLSLKNCHLD